MEIEVENATILIVDDMPANIDVLREVLRERYLLKIATNGMRALEIVAGPAPPDLVLLDIMMPGMDGYEVCRRMKVGRSTRHVPVIFVTAIDDIENEARGFEAGCVDYIIKPVSEPLVLARVATHVRLSRQDQLLQSLLHQRAIEESPLQALGGRA
jgi:putative two-component system response regulator